MRSRNICARNKQSKLKKRAQLQTCLLGAPKKYIAKDVLSTFPESVKDNGKVTSDDDQVTSDDHSKANAESMPSEEKKTNHYTKCERKPAKYFGFARTIKNAFTEIVGNKQTPVSVVYDVKSGNCKTSGLR